MYSDTERVRALLFNSWLAGANTEDLNGVLEIVSGMEKKLTSELRNRKFTKDEIRWIEERVNESFRVKDVQMEFERVFEKTISTGTLYDIRSGKTKSMISCWDNYYKELSSDEIALEYEKQGIEVIRIQKADKSRLGTSERKPLKPKYYVTYEKKEFKYEPLESIGIYEVDSLEYILKNLPEEITLECKKHKEQGIDVVFVVEV